MRATTKQAPGKMGKNWETTHLPEQRDPLHSRLLYPSTNEWGIPDIAHASLAMVPKYLVPFKTRLRHGRTNDGLAVHFFIDDYRFQSAFSKPYAVLKAITDIYTTVLTPDYSVYGNWPTTMNIWNVYRSRWCGAFWNDKTNGKLKIIPSITWADPDSYDYCFAGVPQNSVVAISTVGIRLSVTRRGEWSLFAQGLEAMIGCLKPTTILCYGSLPAEFHSWAKFQCYPTRWQDIRDDQHSKQKKQNTLPPTIVEIEEANYGW